MTCFCNYLPSPFGIDTASTFASIGGDATQLQHRNNLYVYDELRKT
jgi:hypothetical protein